MTTSFHVASEALAQAQLGEPEKAMLAIQFSQIAQLYGYAAEHAGDITNRMAQDPAFFRGGYGMVKEKVDRVHRLLTEDYGFEREVLGQITTNVPLLEGKYASKAEALTELKRLGKNYTEAHKRLEPVNEAQTIARDLAVAIGEFRFRDAVDLVTKLKNVTDQGEEAWSKYALELGATTPKVPAVTIVDIWKQELLKERKAVKTLEERMGRTKRETRDKRDLRKSLEEHQREIEQLERSLQGRGIDVKTLVPPTVKPPVEVPEVVEIPKMEGFGTKTDIPAIDSALAKPEYYATEKNEVVTIEIMSPSEYLDRADKILGLTREESLRVIEQELVDRYSKMMQEGVDFNVPYLDYKRGEQEGRQRAYAAQKAGITEMPVAIVRVAKPPAVKSWAESKLAEFNPPKQSSRGNLRKMVSEIEPMPPDKGPPLPKGLGLKWPWRK